MPVVDRLTLKSYFETGDRPTQSEFENLIDSSFNLADDQLASGWLVRNFEDTNNDDNNNGGFMDFPKPLGVKRITDLRVIGEVSGGGSEDLRTVLLFVSNVAIPGLVSSDNGFGVFYNKIIGDSSSNVLGCAVTPVTGNFDESFSVATSFDLPDFGYFSYWGSLGPLLNSTATFSYHMVGCRFD